jgi:hypothetical protein
VNDVIVFKNYITDSTQPITPLSKGNNYHFKKQTCMKKMILMIAMISIGVYANAQMVLTANVPKATEEKFDALFPKATMVTWEKEGTNYEADFKLDGQSMSAVFTPDGGYVQKEMKIDETALPTEAKEYIGKTYPGKKIVECVKIIKANEAVFYEAEVEKNEMTFDANGKYLSTKKE